MNYGFYLPDSLMSQHLEFSPLGHLAPIKAKFDSSPKTSFLVSFLHED